MSPLASIYRRLIWATVILLAITAIGTIGYWFIGQGNYSVMDAFYMTFITIATIGYGEIVDLSSNPGGRLFTVFISIAGIGVLAYVATNLTAFLVEGELKETFRRRKMESKAKKLREHYIICGLGSVSQHVINELKAAGRPFIVLASAEIGRTGKTLEDEVLLEGNASDNDLLLKAGIMEAQGLFAVTDDDNENLVISLTARQLNPKLRIVASCGEAKNVEKITKVGADAVVSPGLIGGLRIASEMIRPTVVSFLDVMLRDREKNLRVEEIPVAPTFGGRTLSSLGLKNNRGALLLAVKTKDGWTYNPPDDFIIESGNSLIVMTDVKGRQSLEKSLASL